jgi:POT family proton-dependent oligopeptide transporter
LFLHSSTSAAPISLHSRPIHRDMAQNHEDAVAELHATMQQQTVAAHHHATDATGAPLPEVEKGGFEDAEAGSAYDGEEEPTEHERKTLRRIGDKFPASAYLIAVVELCERFAYYG